MTATDFTLLPLDTPIRVTYPDSSHVEPFSETLNKFRDETQEWRDRFFRELCTKGRAYTRFAQYEA